MLLAAVSPVNVRTPVLPEALFEIKLSAVAAFTAQFTGTPPQSPPLPDRPKVVVTETPIPVAFPPESLRSAMLLPALSRAREMARRAVDQSNLKQMGLAVFMYASDYDDYIVPRYWKNQQGSEYWQQLLNPYVSNQGKGSLGVFYDRLCWIG